MRELRSLDLGAVEPGDGDPARARAELRDVVVDDAGTVAPVPVYERARLRGGDVVPGPFVAEEATATTFVQPGWVARVDPAGNLLIREEAE